MVSLASKFGSLGKGYFDERDRSRYEQENMRRQQHQEGLEMSREKRAESSEQRATQTHGLELQRREQELEKGSREEGSAEEKELFELAKAGFFMSDGKDLTALLAWYETKFGEAPRITKDDKGNRALDFGNGKVVPADKATIAGLLHAYQNPDAFQEGKTKKKDREHQTDESIRLHDYKRANPIEQPQYKTDDSGTMHRVEGTTATPVAGAAGEGLTFRGAGSGRTPADVQSVDAIAERLPQIQGESEDERWMRAFEIHATKSGKPLHELEEALYAKVLEKMLPSDSFSQKPETVARARAAAEEEVQRFRERMKERRHREGVSGDPLGIRDPAGGGT